MTQDDRDLIFFYLLMSTGMLPGGFSDLLSDETRAVIKKYQTEIEQLCQNAGNADAK